MPSPRLWRVDIPLVLIFVTRRVTTHLEASNSNEFTELWAKMTRGGGNAHPLNTALIAQLFLSYSDRVWERVLKRGAIDKKFARGGFNFHHKITTDGVSLLYSRSTPSPENSQVLR